MNVNGDSSVETNQNFMVNITNVTGALVSDGQGSGTILNDDVAASADLSVSLVDSSDPVLPGEILSYTVTLTNAGADEATAVSWSDTLATGTTFVSLSSPAGWSCTTPAVGSPGTASWSASSLAAGASGVATLNVNVEASTAAGTVLSNTVTVRASVADPVPANNSATATTTVAMASTTTTIIAHTPSPIVHGQGVSVTYAVTVAAPSTGSPGGSVTVSDGTASCVGTVASGACVLTPTTAGAKTLSATYSGDASFSGSTSPGVAHVVNVVQSYREPSPSGGGDIVVSFSGGGATCSFAHADFSSTLPAAPPAGVRFPHGLFDFVLQGCTPTAVNFTITYPTALPPGTQYWKYGPTPDDTASHWYVLPATITGNQVTFSITDGGLGDEAQSELEEKQAQHKASKKKTKKEIEAEEMAKMQDEINHENLRSVYLSLAKILHPDSETDPELKLEKEEVMKQVTKAYEDKDIIIMLVIETQWLKNTEERLASIKEDVAAIYISLLKDQAKKLRLDKAELRHHPRFQHVVAYVNDKVDRGMLRLSIKKESYELENRNIKKEINIIKTSPRVEVKKFIKTIAKRFEPEPMDDFINFFNSLRF